MLWDCWWVALLLSSCKPYVRQGSEVLTSDEIDVTLRLVAHQDNSVLATLVVCLAMDLTRAEGESDYAAHSLYSRTDGETCFYALHNTKDSDAPYYFTNPRAMQVSTAAKADATDKRGRNLLVSGAVVIGAATALFFATRSNSLLKKIKNLEEIKHKIISYNELRMAKDDVHESVLTKFRTDLDNFVKDLPDDELRASLQKSVDEGMSGYAYTDKAMQALIKDRDTARQLMMASMLGVGAVSVFAFIDEMRSIQPQQHQASALEELFTDSDVVTLNNAELWQMLRLLNSHLSARINPDLISIEGLLNSES